MGKKIIMDTCKWISFYENKEELLELLDDFSKCDNILTTSQLIDEYKRNRVSSLGKLRKEIEEQYKHISQEITINLQYAIFKTDIEFAINKNKIRKEEITESIKSLKNRIDKMRKDKEEDPIYTFFDKIINNPNTTIIEHDEKYYKLAQRRKMLGNPPYSERYTMGDEYIWEQILNNVKEDVLFITADENYFIYSEILKEEFCSKTNKEISFYRSLAEALQNNDVEVEEELSKLEEKQISDDIEKERALKDINLAESFSYLQTSNLPLLDYIEKVSPLLEAVQQLQTVDYSKMTPSMLKVAQQLQTVDYSKMMPPMLKVAQQLQTMDYSKMMPPMLKVAQQLQTMDYSKMMSPMLKVAQQLQTVDYSKMMSPMLKVAQQLSPSLLENYNNYYFFKDEKFGEKKE